ncbi:DUF305 domain-containing protein [Nocardioides sp. GCM10027113]|uniref:DUF305 domain-containing protein n=1 Tax=unclassified Nocardioides TaxID=2615069 RepID=UPI00361EBE3D
MSGVRVPRPVRSVVAAGTVLVALAACSGPADDPATGAEAGREAPVVQPGGPGEPTALIDPADVDPEDPWNHADVAFMQMMIWHHAQALEMSDLAADRAGSPQVRALAERIRAAQGPEIMSMAAWLDERGMEVPRADQDAESWDHAAHGHDGMAGMLTDAEMEQLAAASGSEFDRLFLEGMIGHHEGALEMADHVTVEGEDFRVSELAADVSVSQAAEIGRMEELLRRV